jgi:hypothetical protein
MYLSILEEMGMKKCENKKENEENCSCDEVSCERHGVCCECISYHRSHGDKPMCLR